MAVGGADRVFERRIGPQRHIRIEFQEQLERGRPVHDGPVQKIVRRLVRQAADDLVFEILEGLLRELAGEHRQRRLTGAQRKDQKPSQGDRLRQAHLRRRDDDLAFGPPLFRDAGEEP
jgi:hypothetical protein